MASNLIYRLTTGGLGGAATSTEISATALNNIFDDVDPAEAASGDNEYRAIDIYNDGDAAAEGVVFSVKTDSTSPDSQIDLSADAVSSTKSIADESTPPTSQTFTHNDVPLANIPVSGYCRVWLRRNISTNATNMANDTVEYEVSYA